MTGRDLFKKASALSDAAISLISNRHIQRRVPLTAVAVYLVLLLFGAASLNLAPEVDDVRAEAAALSKEARVLGSKEFTYRGELADTRRIERTTRNVRELTLQLKSQLSDLDTEIETIGEWFERIETITEKSRPPGVEVSNLTPKGDTFSLTASAFTLADAIRYAANIRESGLFTDVTLLQIQSGAGIRAGGDVQPSGSGAATAGSSPSGAGVELDGAERVTFVIEAVVVPPPDEEEEEGKDSQQ